MKYARCLITLATVPVMLLSVGAAGAYDGSAWDGAWTGSQGKRLVWPISISIARGKVVAYSMKGVSFPVRYSNITPAKVMFGDRDNYVIELKKTGDSTATGELRGRKGEGPVTITKN
jgi:hypothetical protein